VENLRKYGKAPYSVVVIHGGPGAPGTMAPVARQLSSNRGVLEPLQTKTSIDGQIQELKSLIKKNGEIPITLIGSSWGAMLGFIFSARYPDYVKKLIMIGSAVFEERYAAEIQETRLSRLKKSERSEILSLFESLNDPEAQDKNNILTRIGDLFTRTDAYKPFTLDTEVLECQGDLFTKVWNEARELRISGQLLKLGKRIRCTVAIIHGDYDPHPVEGVLMPLSNILNDFNFYLLKNCGHLPWIEEEARDKFYAVLNEEIV